MKPLHSAHSDRVVSGLDTEALARLGETGAIAPSIVEIFGIDDPHALPLPLRVAIHRVSVSLPLVHTTRHRPLVRMCARFRISLASSHLSPAKASPSSSPATPVACPHTTLFACFHTDVWEELRSPCVVDNQEYPSYDATRCCWAGLFTRLNAPNPPIPLPTRFEPRRFDMCVRFCARIMSYFRT